MFADKGLSLLIAPFIALQVLHYVLGLVTNIHTPHTHKYAAVLCSGLRSPTHGRVRARRVSFGSTASYSCFAGYGLVGNSTRVCQSDGQWSGEMPLCERKYM